MIKSLILSSEKLVWGEFYADVALTSRFGKSHHLEVAQDLGLSVLALPIEDPALGEPAKVKRALSVKDIYGLEKLDFSTILQVDLSHFKKAQASFETFLLLDGPFEYFSSLMPFEDWIRGLKKEPHLVKEMMQAYMEALASLVKSKKVLTAGLVLADDLAGSSGPIYSPQMLDELYFPFLKSFCAECAEDLIIHCDGDVYSLLDSYEQAGVAGMQSLEWAGPKVMEMLVSRYPKLIFWGGLRRQQLVFEKKQAMQALTEMMRLRSQGALVMVGSSTGILDGEMDPDILSMVGRRLQAQ